MSVRIRLSRIGKKHAPFYRVVSVDKRKKRDGAFLEDLGTFDPLKGVVVCFNEDGYKKRIEQGAIPSDAVKKIYALFKEPKRTSGLSVKSNKVEAAPQVEAGEVNQ